MAYQPVSKVDALVQSMGMTGIVVHLSRYRRARAGVSVAATGRRMALPVAGCDPREGT